jgi:hypothetical protein
VGQQLAAEALGEQREPAGVVGAAALMNSASSAPIRLVGRCSVVFTMSPTVAGWSPHVDGRACENQSVGKLDSSQSVFFALLILTLAI